MPAIDGEVYEFDSSGVTKVPDIDWLTKGEGHRICYENLEESGLVTQVYLVPGDIIVQGGMLFFTTVEGVGVAGVTVVGQ